MWNENNCDCFLALSFVWQVSRISDIFTCLLEYEEQLILKQKSSSSQPQTIAAVNTVLKVRISDCKRYLTLKLLTILIQKEANIWSEKREISIRGLLVDPISNSQNYKHYKSCKADSFESYFWDLGSTRVQLCILKPCAWLSD